MFGSVHDELALDGPHAVHLVLREQLVTGDHQRVHVGDGATCSLKTSKVNKNHRLLLLKLDKQSGGTIYRPFLAQLGHLYTLICCKNCNLCLKKTKINEKEAGVGPFFKKTIPGAMMLSPLVKPMISLILEKVACSIRMKTGAIS